MPLSDSLIASYYEVKGGNAGAVGRFQVAYDRQTGDRVRTDGVWDDATQEAFDWTAMNMGVGPGVGEDGPVLQLTPLDLEQMDYSGPAFTVTHRYDDTSGVPVYTTHGSAAPTAPSPAQLVLNAAQNPFGTDTVDAGQRTFLDQALGIPSAERFQGKFNCSLPEAQLLVAGTREGWQNIGLQTAAATTIAAGLIHFVGGRWLMLLSLPLGLGAVVAYQLSRGSR